MVQPFASLTASQIDVQCDPSGGAPTGNWTASDCPAANSRTPAMSRRFASSQISPPSRPSSRGSSAPCRCQRPRPWSSIRGLRKWLARINPDGGSGGRSSPSSLSARPSSSSRSPWSSMAATPWSSGARRRTPLTSRPWRGPDHRDLDRRRHDQRDRRQRPGRHHGDPRRQRRRSGDVRPGSGWRRPARRRPALRQRGRGHDRLRRSSADPGRHGRRDGRQPDHLPPVHARASPASTSGRRAPSRPPAAAIAAAPPGGTIFPAGISEAFFETYPFCTGEVGSSPECAAAAA